MARKRDYLSPQNKGLIQDLVFQAKLIWRLLKDPRVSIFLKLLPIGALIYLVSPIDLLPGVAFPVIGALDDAAVVWLGGTLFITLCPQDVVQEHRNALENVIQADARDVTENYDQDKSLEERHEDKPDDVE